MGHQLSLSFQERFGEVGGTEGGITGKVITSIGKNLKTTQITIPATEIPEQAVTLSFFVD